MRGLKRQCHEGGIRIPFIARWPGHVPAGKVNDHICAFYDLMPTFCDVAGIKNYEKKYRNKEKEVDYFKTESLSKLEQDMRQKEKDAEDRLTSAKEKASQEIASLTSELTIKAVKKAVAKHLDKAAQSKLIDNSIALLSKLK